MEIKAIDDRDIAEVLADSITINNVEEGTGLVGNLVYSGYQKVILYQKNITPGFFELKTGIAGEILQKFTNYRVRVAIVGNFSEYNSKSLADFIFESNKHTQVNFVATREEAIARLTR